IVLAVDPGQVEEWSDEEVVRRWQAVFPGAVSRTDDEKQKERITLALRSDPERMKIAGHPRTSY
ncbi:MAG: hypothetical protein LAT56_12255, partial [Wenzhouxiangella sp.]|nr:hypothetical protein [Wenzhouxiangella sp.]